MELRPTRTASLPPHPEGDLSEAESLRMSDVEDRPGCSGVASQPQSQDLTVPTTPLTPTTAATTLIPVKPTCVPASTSTTATASKTVPEAVAPKTTSHHQDAGDSVQGQVLAPPQARVCREGGRAPLGQSQVETETEAMAKLNTVLGAYQQNQGQMCQVLEELRKLRLLQRFMDTRLGQIADYMGQLVGVLRDMHAAQEANHPPSDQPDVTENTTPAATGRGEAEGSSDTSEHAAGSPTQTLEGTSEENKQRITWQSTSQNPFQEPTMMSPVLLPALTLLQILAHIPTMVVVYRWTV